MKFLSLVPIYLAPQQDLLPRLGERLSSIFDLPTRVRPPWFDPEEAFHASRGQYHSTLLLKSLLGEPPEQGTRILGVTSVDLFIPVLTYVFGEAQLDGRAAVVSIHRLRNENYGLPADEKQLFDRLCKESVHELGHAYGLIHCANSECVMHSSTYVEDIDLKSDLFCPVCENGIGRGL